MNTTPRHRAFVCYSHEDAPWLERLMKMLRPALQSDDLLVWSDKDIPPGARWEQDLHEALSNANVALLLVSANFLASDFITKVELPVILGKASQVFGLTVLWIPISACIYEGTEIAQYQAVLDPTRPLDQLTKAKLNSALKTVGDVLIREIRRLNPPNTILTAPVEMERKSADVSARASVQVTYRHESEIAGGDETLRKAVDAKFIALTYKTLGLALTRGGLTLPHVKEIELAVYSLPLLHEWHPTLRRSGKRLSREWVDSVTRVLGRLTSSDCCPLLSRLTIRVINRVPTFTASVVTTSDDGRSSDAIRIRLRPSSRTKSRRLPLPSTSICPYLRMKVTLCLRHMRGSLTICDRVACRLRFL